MPKFVFWIGAVFLAIGLAMLGGAAWVEQSARAFDASALKATGTVVDLSRRASDDGDVYAPVVVWFDDAGTRHEFVGGVGSSPPSYSRGEQVPVLYPPGMPGRARVGDFTNRYLVTMVLGGLGTIFALVGGGTVFFYVRKRRRIAHLKGAGAPIEAKFLETWRDSSIAVNGRHPYRVAAQATHPSTGKLCRFESGPIWVDPTEALQGRTVRVLIDPSDPESHFVDLSRWVDEDDML